MKKLISNLILSLIILVLVGCRQDNTPVPLKFKAYEHNPILTPGQPGSWDELMIMAPQVYWYDSLFYLFYAASNISNKAAVGLATSKDGYHFEKYEVNPILAPDGTGYDANLVAGCVLLYYDTIWTMYFGAGELIRYGPGQTIGRATAEKITGPWIRDEKPILASGNTGEWDAGFIFPTSFVKMEEGSYRMYYTGGGDFQGEVITYTGMATSADGITWKKYNDPATHQHPFEESDPVLPIGNKKDWDSHGSWCAFVYKNQAGFNMYYTGSNFNKGYNETSIGFAYSKDGILWEKFTENPVFTVKDDPFSANALRNMIIEGSWLVFQDTVCYMYYDYGVIVGKIGMATARVK
jgi:sucrose-6-phosphate hydrolase SacC (GH32 family)